MSRFNRHCNLIGISLVNQIGIVKWKSHSNVSSMAGIPIVDIGATLKCDSNAFPMSTIAMCALGTLGLHSNSIRKWVAWGERAGVSIQGALDSCYVVAFCDLTRFCYFSNNIVQPIDISNLQEALCV